MFDVLSAEFPLLFPTKYFSSHLLLHWTEDHGTARTGRVAEEPPHLGPVEEALASPSLGNWLVCHLLCSRVRDVENIFGCCLVCACLCLCPILAPYKH